MKESEEIKSRNCGYCGNTLRGDEKQLLNHVHICEIENVNKNYREFGGKH